MSLESVVERFASLYASCASYVLGPDGYRFWMDCVAEVLAAIWPGLVVIALVALGFGVYRMLARAQSERERYCVRVGQDRRTLFRSGLLPWKRLPLVYEPGGFNRRRKDGRWR